MNVNELHNGATYPVSTSILWFVRKGVFLYYQYRGNARIYRARVSRKFDNVLTHGSPSVGRVMDLIKNSASVYRWNGNMWILCKW